MKISKITVQQKNKDRYNIFAINNGREEFAFSVDENVLVKWNLRKGVTLTEKEATIILQNDEITKAYNKAIQYLTRAMRTEYQIKEHLRKKEFDENIIEEAIHKLKRYRYIDDEEYAKAYVRTQMNTTDKGPVVIRDELLQKGASATVIEDALAFLTENIQLETAQRFLLKKGKQKKNESTAARKKRLIESLLRKGFSTEIAWKAWERMEEELPENNDMEAVYKQGEKIRRKWQAKYSGKQLEWKIKENLYRKGFDLVVIEEYLQRTESEINREEV